MEATTKGREIAAYREGFVPVRLQSYNEALRFAKELLDTGLLPSHIKKPGQALAIILTGQEMGIPPMRALRTIYVVEGQPAMKAEQMLALFKRNGGRAHEVESSDKKCTWQFRHPNGDEHTETLTFEDVKPFAVLGNGKVKDNWRKMPRVMLRWRTIAFGLRVAAPDLFGGVYTPEEIEEVGEQTEDATAENMDDLKARLIAANAAKQAAGEIEVTAEEIETQDTAELPVCKECGTELTLDNLADEGLCLGCAEKKN